MKHRTMLVSILIALFSIIFFSTDVNAASAGISASKTNAEVGESVSINVSVNAATWNVKVNGSGVSNESIVGYNSDGNNENTSKSLKLDTSKAGTYTIQLTGDITDGSTDENSSVNKSVTVTVKEKEVEKPAEKNETKKEEQTQTNNNEEKKQEEQKQEKTQTENTASSNAKLNNLGVYTYDFKGFKPDTTSYNVTVPNEVTSVSVYASVQEDGAVYHVMGDKNLDVGTNKVTIIVTAPDKKTTKTYYIYVARKSAENSEVVPNVIEENKEEQTEEKEKLALISIAIDEEQGLSLEPEFKSDVLEYKIKLKDNLESLKLNAIANREDAKVKITGNDSLKKEKNTVKITVTSNDEQEKIEYKITIIKDKKYVEENKTENKVKTEDLNNKNSKKETKSNTNWLLIVGMILGAIILIALVFGVIVLKTKRRGKH